MYDRAEEEDKTMVSYRFLTSCGRKGGYERFNDCCTLLREWDCCAVDEELSAKQTVDDVKRA